MGINALDAPGDFGATEETFEVLEPEAGGEEEEEEEEDDDKEDDDVEVVQAMETDAPSTEEQARQEAEALNVEAAVEELESKHAMLQEEHETAREQLERTTKDLSASQAQVTKLNEEKLQLEQQFAEAKRVALTAGEGNKTLEQEQKNQKERMDRMEAEADSLREEIRCAL